jgi:phage/plasmid primase-like uncharacterized protein|tara:strand:- start:4216 stop:4713 length:498 start_codon:yes stop_codon:yes gene_type:complete
MRKFIEVTPFTGRPVEEDAPTNATGTAVAGTGDDSSVVPVKKKKRFLDARTKAYRTHAEKLAKMRERRSKLKETVLNKADNFERALYMVEDNIDMLRDIVKKKQNKSIKFKDGQMRVDLMTASTITQVYDKVNTTNKKKIGNMVNGSKRDFLKISNAVYSLANKK